MINFVQIKINTVTLIFLISVFMPFPPVIFGIYGEVSSLLAMFITVVLLSVSGDAKIDKSAFLIFVILFSVLLISISRDSERIFKDFIELSRPLMWILTYSVFYSLCWVSDVKKLISRILSFLYLVAAWGIVEVFIPDGVFFHDLYKLEGSVYKNKAIASFIAPYSFAAVMGLGLAISYARVKSGSLSSIKGYFLVGLFLTSILLAQSKSGILGAFIILIAYELRYPRFASLVLMVIVFLSLYHFIIISNLLPYVSSFISNVWGAYLDSGTGGLAGSSPSIGNRVEQLEAVISKIDTLPLIGAGVGKGYLYLESLYALWLFRYGLIGYLILAIVSFNGIIICRKLRNKFEVHSIESALLTAFPFITLYFFVVSISSNVIDQFRVALFYIAFLAIIRAIYMRHKFASHSATNYNNT